MRPLPVERWADHWGIALAFAVGAILLGVLCGAIESLTKLQVRRGSAGFSLERSGS